VFVVLCDHLPEDYLVYYDIAVDGQHPDFIIVGPDRVPIDLFSSASRSVCQSLKHRSWNFTTAPLKSGPSISTVVLRIGSAQERAGMTG
jgi:hypothetical protein